MVLSTHINKGYVKGEFTLEEAERKGDLGQDMFEQWYYGLPSMIRKAAGTLIKRPRHGDRLGRPDYIWPKIGLEMELKNLHEGTDIWAKKAYSKIASKAWRAKHEVCLFIEHVDLTHGAPELLQNKAIAAIMTFKHFLTYLMKLLGALISALLCGTTVTSNGVNALSDSGCLFSGWGGHFFSVNHNNITGMVLGLNVLPKFMSSLTPYHWAYEGVSSTLSPINIVSRYGIPPYALPVQCSSIEPYGGRGPIGNYGRQLTAALHPHSPHLNVKRTGTLN